jgi:hypothetical protein
MSLTNSITIANAGTTSTTYSAGFSKITGVYITGQNGGADTLTFRVSFDDSTYTNLVIYNPGVTTPVSTMTITPATTSPIYIALPLDVFSGARYIKVVSSAPISSSGCTITFY